MRYLPTENWTKSVSNNFTDGITDGQDLLVIKKMNITDGKAYSSVIYVIILTETDGKSMSV